MRRPGFIPTLILLTVLLGAASLFAQKPPAAPVEPLSSPAEAPMPVLEALVASPLVSVVEEVAAELRRGKDLDVHIETGSTEYLLARLGRDTGGADLILLESREALSLLVGSGLVDAADVITQASDRLAVVVRKEDRGRQPLQYLAEIQPGRILIENPETTMAGLHAKQSLSRIGLWEKISFKVRHADTPVQVLGELRQGSVDAAVLYLSTAIQAPDLVSILTMPKDSHFAILYFGVPLKASPRRDLARAFLRRLASPLSQESWLNAGFHPPPAELP